VSFREGFVGRSEDRERTRSLQCLDETCGFHGSYQCIEFGGDGGVEMSAAEARGMMASATAVANKTGKCRPMLFPFLTRFVSAYARRYFHDYARAPEGCEYQRRCMDFQVSA
jgi:hypothetical protein